VHSVTSYAVTVACVVFRLTCRSVVCQVATAEGRQMAVRSVCDVTHLLGLSQLESVISGYKHGVG